MDTFDCNVRLSGRLPTGITDLTSVQALVFFGDPLKSQSTDSVCREDLAVTKLEVTRYVERVHKEYPLSSIILLLNNHLTLGEPVAVQVNCAVLPSRTVTSLRFSMNLGTSTGFCVCGTARLFEIGRSDT